MSKPNKYDNYYTDEEPIQCSEPGHEHQYLCSGCVEEGHIQGSAREYYDCKMVFIKDGKSIGQCQCYGPAHGKRE